MSRRTRSLAALAMVAVGGITAQGATAMTAHRASAAVLKVAKVKVAIGTTNRPHPLIVTAKGLPVYLLTGDSPHHPLCKGGCLTYWPAVTSRSRKPALGAGVKGKVGVWHHNGVNQVTLNGHPLYTFAQDSRGAALGEGVKSFGGVWEVIGAGGAPMAKSRSTSSGGSSSGGSSSGGW